jgi:hypothetical protein
MFKTTSRQGLKIHNSKVHCKKIDFKECPAACGACEKILDNEIKLKKHKKEEHSYQYVKFQRNECDFMANEPQTLHVKFGKLHSVKELCGLVIDLFTTLNSGCRDTYEKVSDISEHIQKEHKTNSPEHYQFSYWNFNSKDKSDTEICKQYKTRYPKEW